MRQDGYTSIGGNQGAFETTQWATIERVRAQDPEAVDNDLSGILEAYWKPVYCYLRKKGYTNEDAKDLTQGFFEEVVLGRDLIERAERTRGRFRTFILSALNHYLVSVRRKQTAKKRAPKGSLLNLDEIPYGDLPDIPDDLHSEESFNYAWVSTLLDRVFSQVQAECIADGLGVHWALFFGRVLEPITDPKGVPDMAALCKQYDIESESKASNMIFVVKRRLQKALRWHLRTCVSAEVEVDEEIQDILRFFTESRQSKQ